MKKRMLSLFLCFVLCLSLCPIAAWADEAQESNDYAIAAPLSDIETEAVSEYETESTSEDETDSVPEDETESASEEESESISEEETESTSEDETESASEEETSDESVAAVQARIDALPDEQTVAAMDEAQRDEVYMTAQDICDAIDALDEAQRALLNTDALEALLVWFSEQTEATGSHIHCLCGKSACSSHGGTHTFVEWTDALAASQNGEGKSASNSLPSDPNGGYYYLTQDVVLTQRWTPRKNTVLCLNGHNISMTTNDGIVIVVAGTFTLTDCQTTGRITTAADKTGCGVAINPGKTFNLYGGNISGNINTGSVGGVEVSEGAVFNMYGGSVSDNRAEKGAGVYNRGTFNMYGGSISSNTGKDDIATSFVYGAGVYNEGTVNLSGGSIASNVATQGGGVYNVVGSCFTMSGGSIDSNTAYGYGRNGQVKNADGGGVYNEGKKSTGTATFIMSGGSITANRCGGANVLTGGTVHGHGAGVYNNGTFTLSGGSISSNTMDIFIGSDDVNGDAGAYGGGVYTGGIGSFTMSGGSVSDNAIESHSSQMESAGAKHSHGGGVYVSNGSFTMSGGTISNNHAVYGGGVYVGSGSFELVKGSVTNNTAAENGGGIENHGTATLGEADLTGTQIFVTGNKTEATLGGFGGGIVNYGELTVSGGATIHSNTANAGGGIANHGTLTLTGGALVTGNSADSGGGVYNAETATLENTVIRYNAAPKGGGIRSVGTLMLGDGAQVTANTASTSGGGIEASGTLTINGSAQIFENTAPVGGGLCVYGTTTLGGNATICNNSATDKGGGIENSGTLTMTDSFVVSDNTAPNGGGLYNSGTATLEGMTRIRSNTASASGGGVYNDGTVTLDGTTIEMNSAEESGGGVYNAKTLKIESGTIGARSNGSGNTAANGGGVYNADTITMTCGYIMYNTATASGGGVYDAGKNFNISGTFSWVSYNTATEYGGGIYHESGTLNMNGGAVTANRAYEQGGGVYYRQNEDGATHPVKLNGQVTLTGNYGGGTTSNLYLSWPTTLGSTRTLDIMVGTLFGNCRIGLSSNHTPTDSYQYVTISSSTNANNKGYFVSDSGEYKVELVGSQLVLLRDCAHAHLGQEPSGDYTCQDCGKAIAAGVTTTATGAAVTYYSDINDALSALAWDGTGILRLMRAPSGTMTLNANKSYRLEYGEGVDLLGSTIKVTAGHVTLCGESFGNIVESKNGTYSTGDVILDVDSLPASGIYFQSIKTERSGRAVFSLLRSDDDIELYGFVREKDDISRSIWYTHTTTATQLSAVKLKRLPYTGLTMKTGDWEPSATETITYGDSIDLGVEMTGATETPAPGIMLESNTVFSWSVNNEIMLEGRGETAFTFYTKLPGIYTIVCQSRYRGYTQQAKITVVVEPAVVSVSDFDVEDRLYDGSAKATVTPLSVTAADGAVLREGTDYSISALFDDANVGVDKPVTVTVTLKNAGYVFHEDGEDTSETTFNKTATIEKLPCAEAGNVIRYVQNGTEKTYAFSLNALLNTLQSEQGYGEIVGSGLVYVPEPGAEAYYSDAEGQAARFETNEATGALQIKLPMQTVSDEAQVQNRSKIGTLYVDVSSENVELTKKTGGPEGMEEYTISISVYVTAIEVPDANSDLLALERRSITYGETLDDIERQANEYGEQYGRFDWKNAEDAKKLFDVGPHWIDWKFTLTGETEPILEGVVPITVNKATPLVTAEAESKVYDGQPLDDSLVTVKAVNPVDDALTVEGSWSWKSEAPKDACTEQEYTVVFTPDDLNSYTTAETTVLVTIEQRDVSITGVTAVDRSYESNNDTVELEGGELSQASDTPSVMALFRLLDGAANSSGVLPGDMVSFHLGEGKLDTDDCGDNKRVTTNITLVGRDAANYKLSQPTGIRVNIKAKDLSDCLIEVEALCYTGEAQAPRVYVEGVQVPATFVETTPQTEPGEYTLTIVLPNGNYRFGNEASRVFDWSITKAPAIQLTDATVAVHYDDHSDHSYPLSKRSGVPESAGEIVYTLGSAPDGMTVSIDENGTLTYSVTGMGEADVGQVLIVPLLIESAHYEPMTVSLVVTVTDKKIPTVTAADVSKIYDGKAVSASGTATFGGAELAGTWSWKSGGAYGAEDAPSAQPVHVQDSGVWRLVFTPDDDATYTAVEELVSVTIEPKAVTLQSAEARKTYDGTALENSGRAVTADGMVEGEAFDYDFTGSQTAVGHSENRFTAKDSATARVSDYAIDYRFGTLTVTQPKSTTPTGGSSPAKTGDVATPLVWATAFLLALSASVCLLLRRKKRR